MPEPRAVSRCCVLGSPLCIIADVNYYRAFENGAGKRFDIDDFVVIAGEDGHEHFGLDYFLFYSSQFTMEFFLLLLSVVCCGMIFVVLSRSSSVCVAVLRVLCVVWWCVACRGDAAVAS